MNWNQALFPSLKRRGGCAIKKMSRSNLSSRRRGGQIGEIFRPEEIRRTDHPVCGASEASPLEPYSRQAGGGFIRRPLWARDRQSWRSIACARDRRFRAEPFPILFSN